MTNKTTATESMVWVLAATAGMALISNAHAAPQERTLPFDQAELFLELNDTDGDLGLHGAIDGDPWKVLEVEDPNGRTIIEIEASGDVRRRGLTQLAFESAEPPFDELSPDVFFERFPEGEYTITGKKRGFRSLESETMVSHVLTAPVGNVLVAGQPAA